MPITLNGTTGVTYPDGVTQASGVPTASATSGAPLVSNGSVYTQTTPVGVAFGGTGATSNAAAPFALKGANSDITALSGLTTPLSVAQGGTGLSTTPTNGQLNIGNGSGFSRATLTQGSGISITNGAGSITIAATGGGTVTSVATGNGLTGGTITGSGTLSITAPSYQSVGSYMALSLNALPTVPNSNYSGLSILYKDSGGGIEVYATASGTWRFLGMTDANNGLYLRVS